MTTPTPGKHGGKRPGAGRPKGYKQAAVRAAVGAAPAKPKAAKADKGPPQQRQAEGGQTGHVDSYALLAKSKAKREYYRANEAELDYRTKIGELCEVAEVQRVFATVIATMVQGLRNIPDMLERRVGLTPAQAEQSEEVINGELAAMKEKLMGALNATR